jgi:lincosamide nucleotidyltransferase A/C/D/E
VPEDGVVQDQERMSVSDVLEVVEVVGSVGCRFWLEGGWGVDALVGRVTRPHRDVDVDFDAACEDAVLEALADLGYSIETDWRPNRVTLGGVVVPCVSEEAQRLFHSGYELRTIDVVDLAELDRLGASPSTAAGGTTPTRRCWVDGCN